MDKTSGVQPRQPRYSMANKNTTALQREVLTIVEETKVQKKNNQNTQPLMMYDLDTEDNEGLTLIKRFSQPVDENKHPDKRQQQQQQTTGSKNKNSDSAPGGSHNNTDSSASGSTNHPPSSDFTPKRCRSERPNSKTLTQVLYTAHMKLLQSRARQHKRLSPGKLAEKNQSKQARAEQLRATLQFSRQQWFDKVRAREEQTRERVKLSIQEKEEKERRLFEKMEQAAIKKETELQQIIEKARGEGIKIEQNREKTMQLEKEEKDKIAKRNRERQIQAAQNKEFELQQIAEKARGENIKMEETYFIAKMTMENQRLDLVNKMSDNEERKRAHLQSTAEKVRKNIQQRKETADKNRANIDEETKTKFLTNEQKRDQAASYRREQLREKQKSMFTKYSTKRDLVIARKNYLAHKASDIMSFVNNSGNLWDFILMECDWQSMALEDPAEDDWYEFTENMQQLMPKDEIELRKMLLRRDAEILNYCSHYDERGNLVVTKNPMTIMHRQLDGMSSSSSVGSNYYNEDPDDETKMVDEDDQSPRAIKGSKIQYSVEDGRFRSNTYKLKKQDSKHSSDKTRRRQRLTKKSSSIISREDITTVKLDLAEGNFFNGADATSQDEETKEAPGIINTEEGELSPALTPTPAQQTGSAKFAHGGDYVDGPDFKMQDDYFDFKLHQQRLQMSMRRNVLKRNLSEDLTWAGMLKETMGEVLDNTTAEPPTTRQSYNKLDRSRKNNLKTRSLNSTPERSKPASHLFGTVELSGHDSDIDPADKITTPAKEADEAQRVNGSTASKKPRRRKKLNRKKRQASQQSGGGKNLNSVTILSSGPAKKSLESIVPVATLTLKGGKNSNHNSTSSLHAVTPSNIELLQQPSEELTQKNLTLKQLEMLGPMVKMTIGGFPLTSQQQPTSVFAPMNQMLQRDNSSLGYLSGRDSQDGQDGDEPDITSTSAASSFLTSSTTSFHMHSLIMNKGMRQRGSLYGHNPRFDTSKSNLHPICTQKILLRYPGKEGQFAAARISLKLEEVKLISGTQLIQQFQQQTLSEDLEAVQKPCTPKAISSKAGAATNKDSANSTPTKAHMSKAEALMATPPSKGSLDQLTDSLAKYLFQENIQLLKQNESQTSLAYEGSQAANVLQMLESTEVTLRFCRLCEVLITPMAKQSAQKPYAGIEKTSNLILCKPSPIKIDLKTSVSVSPLQTPGQSPLLPFTEIDHIPSMQELDLSQQQSTDQWQQAISDHFQLKSHQKKREELGIKEIDDLQLSLLVLTSAPGDIENELRIEKEKALKRLVKRLKQQINSIAVTHENASTYPGRELNSAHKKRLQIRCMELEKTVIPMINNYDTVLAILADVQKVLAKRNLADLHLMRKLKFIPILVEICKRISVCPKNEIKQLGKVLSPIIKIVQTFCTLRENRNYMLQTNRMSSLLELLYWSLNRSTQIFFAIDFLPDLFSIFTSMLKHRVPYECQQMKELFVDLLISSQVPLKLRRQFSIVKQFQGQELTEMMGQVPYFLLKAVQFVESLTAMLSIDARTRPAYEQSYKIGEHVFFVVQNTELLGILSMIATLLLTLNDPFKASQKDEQELLLPQTVLSLAIISMKSLNNMIRMDVKFVQDQLKEDQAETLYHLLNFLLVYCEANLTEENDDVKELLHETLLFIGYYCLLNEENQNMLQRGENSILQKLCNLPLMYFMNKRLKDIFFPTMIACTYQNNRSVQICDQEMEISMMEKFVQVNLDEKLPEILEMEQESDHTAPLSFGGSRCRSPQSISSTGSHGSDFSLQMDFMTGNNPYLPLYMRFPKRAWKDAIQFYQQSAM